MQPLPFTLTNESLTLINKGVPQVFPAGTAQFQALRKALMANDWTAVETALAPGGAIAAYLGEGFTLDQGRILYQGKPIPAEIAARADQMSVKGEDPSPLFKFWERLKKNPSSRSVEQLYPFLAHEGIAIEPDGTFLAYKGVRTDLKDQHSGKFDNSPGQVHTLPRNEISDDPNHACHFGFHVGALAYAKDFAPTVVICRVDPENVVCIPYDCGQQKMRVCKYEVVGFWTGEAPLSSTTEEVDVEPGPVPEEALADEDDYEDDFDYEDDDTAQATEEPAAPVQAKPSRKVVLDATSLKQLARMKPRQLLDVTIDGLRAYASVLKIVGASKLPGGKTALVGKIVKARKRTK